MRNFFRQFGYVSIGILWSGAIVIGGMKLTAYESKKGEAARAPLTLPTSALVPATEKLPTLIVLLHPRCPCSRASLGELAKVMTACHGKLAATVLVIRPEGEMDGWEKTDLWTSAAAIPGVTVRVDEDGKESAKFGGDTSGEVLLYAVDGRLVFSGGITESRGHSGDNAGESAVISLVLNPLGALPAAATTPVYGCALFNSKSTCTQNGGVTCPR